MAGVIASIAGPTYAGPYTEALTKCVVTSTTASDRTTMMRWMLAGLSAAPEVSTMTSLSEAQREQIARDTALLLQRVMTEDCREETLNALGYEGTTSLTTAFEAFGKSAAEQLFSNPAVEREADRMTKHIDHAKFDALSKELSRKR